MLRSSAPPNREHVVTAAATATAAGSCTSAAPSRFLEELITELDG